MTSCIAGSSLVRDRVAEGSAYAKGRHVLHSAYCVRRPSARERIPTQYAIRDTLGSGSSGSVEEVRHRAAKLREQLRSGQLVLLAQALQPAASMVDVDDASARVHHPDQRHLGGEVLLHLR